MMSVERGEAMGDEAKFKAGDRAARLREIAAEMVRARALEAVYLSMHNGEMRRPYGKRWYGSPDFNQAEVAVLVDMGCELPRALVYIDALEVALAEVTRERDALAAAVKAATDAEGEVAG